MDAPEMDNVYLVTVNVIPALVATTVVKVIKLNPHRIYILITLKYPTRFSITHTRPQLRPLIYIPPPQLPYPFCYIFSKLIRVPLGYDNNLFAFKSHSFTNPFTVCANMLLFFPVSCRRLPSTLLAKGRIY